MKKLLVLIVCVLLTGCSGVEMYNYNDVNKVKQSVEMQVRQEPVKEQYTFVEIETEEIPIEVNALRCDICDVMGWVATDYNLGFPEFTLENMRQFDKITSDYRILYLVDENEFAVHIFDGDITYNYIIDSDGNVEYNGETERVIKCGDNSLDKCIDSCVKKHRLNVDSVEVSDDMVVLNNYHDVVEFSYEDSEPVITALSYHDIDTNHTIDIKY